MLEQSRSTKPASRADASAAASPRARNLQPTISPGRDARSGYVFAVPLGNRRCHNSHSGFIGRLVDVRGLEEPQYPGKRHAGEEAEREYDPIVSMELQLGKQVTERDAEKDPCRKRGTGSV